MKKFLIFSFLLSFIATGALFAAPAAAPDVTVTVKDSKTKEAVEYATVELLNEKDSVITGGITDAKGYINMPCATATGKIRIQFIGYKTYEAPVAGKDLGTVFLEEDAKLLNEVTVVGQTRTTKIDRDVFVITKEQRAGTATSRELLGKLNGVQYNPYDQSLMVNGKSNILILVDGIEKEQNMAKTLPPDRIARVEVIKDPVGKYVADGYSAVINIITKKDFSGIDITANFNPMLNFTKYYAGPSPLLQENSGLNLLYTHDKLNLYGSYSGYWIDAKFPSEYSRQYDDLLIRTSPMDDRHPNTISQGVTNNFALGGDYLLKPENTISLELNYNSGINKKIKPYDLTTYLNNVAIGESQSINNSRGTYDALQATLTYLGKWSEKSRFEGNLRYRHSMPTNSSDFTQGAMYSISHNSQVENFYRLNLDYTCQFTPKFSMDVAYGILIDNFNLYQDNQIFTQYQVRNRPSFYLSYNPDKHWSMKLGGMVEFYNQSFTTLLDPVNNPNALTKLKQSRTGLLPDASIMYKPIEKFSVTAKYHSYPGYPDINSLSTFRTQIDTLTWSVGNPELKMSNEQGINLDINFLNHFTVSPFYGFSLSNIQQYLWEDNGQYVQSPVNVKFNQYGVNCSFDYPITKALSWQLYMFIGHQQYTYGDLSNGRTSNMGSTSLYYNIPKWDAAAYVEVGKYIARWATLQGYNANGNDYVMLMVQKNFFKKRLSCSFNYFLPVTLGNFLTYQTEYITQTQTYYSSTRGNYDLLKNAISLQITFHFNSGKQGNFQRSSLDNDNNVKQKNAGLGL